MTSGIQLQEAPPKDGELEPEIRPKRRLWICRGLCGFDGTRPCWCCSPCCFVITLVVLWLLFLIIMFIGQAVEQAEVDKAPDTDWVYDTLEVCSASNRTYATLDAARSAGQLSRHCGACGQCSNAHDIQIYHDTKATLTETSTACAMRSITEGAAARVHGHGAGRHHGTIAPQPVGPAPPRLNVPPLAKKRRSFQSRRTLGPASAAQYPRLRRLRSSPAPLPHLGAEGVTACFERDVNLTKGCTRCWVDNVMCDLRRCVFSCLLYRMGLGGSTNQGDKEGELSNCLRCDEKLCGPAFITCAGANRRRSGVVSDIERNGTHVCKQVDVGPGATT